MKEGSEIKMFVTNRNTAYCNEFAGSISQWKFITLRIQYTIVNYSRQRFYNSNTRITSTSSLTQLLITVSNSITHVRTLSVL
jgi:hypothetical protein